MPDYILLYCDKISKQIDAAELTLTVLSMWSMLKIFFPNFAGSVTPHTACLLGLLACLQTLIPTAPQPAPPIPSSSVFFFSWALIFALRGGIPLVHLSGSRLFSFSKRHDVTFQLYLAYFILRRTHGFTRNIYSV